MFLPETARIQVVGHVCVDLTPRFESGGFARPGELIEVGPLTWSVGGVVGNCGRVLSELGVEGSVAGAVGDDKFGAICRQVLQRRHGDRVDLTVLPHVGTSYSVVIEPEGSDRSFWHHTGANDLFTGDCEITPGQLLHFGYPSLVPGMCRDSGTPILRLFERAHDQGVATSLDLAFLATNSPLRGLDWEAFFRALLPACDVFCPSWGDLASCLGLPADAGDDTIVHWAQQFLSWGASIVLITLGNRGSYLRVGDAARLSRPGSAIDLHAWEGSSHRISATPLDEIVTTNGAGDAYKAAFLAGLVSGAGPMECLEFARTTVGRYVSGRPLTAIDSPERSS